MDRLFLLDMQKDTVVTSITSVMLDPTNKNIPVTIDGITSVAVNGTDLGFNGYLDIGLYDTMADLFAKISYTDAERVQKLSLSFRALAPALLFVSLMCAYRGYLQGMQMMTGDFTFNTKQVLTRIRLREAKLNMNA